MEDQHEKDLLALGAFDKMKWINRREHVRTRKISRT